MHSNCGCEAYNWRTCDNKKERISHETSQNVHISVMHNLIFKIFGDIHSSSFNMLHVDNSLHQNFFHTSFFLQVMFVKIRLNTIRQRINAGIKCVKTFCCKSSGTIVMYSNWKKIYSAWNLNLSIIQHKSLTKREKKMCRIFPA